MLSQQPDISVIVCHHTGDLVHGFLESIMKSKGVRFEVIVITSDPVFRQRIDGRIKAFYMTGPPAARRNFGVKQAKGQYLAFFDDDTTIDEHCLTNFKQTIDNNDCDMVYGKLWNMEHRNRFDEAGGFMTWTGFIWSRAGQNDVDTGQYDSLQYILAGKSASCMMTRKSFLEVGGFDEEFGILGEESLLSWRLWIAGYKVMFCPTATGWHAFNTKFKPQEKHYTSERVHFNGCRNYNSMLIQCLGRSHLWIVPIHFLIWFIASVAKLITGKFEAGGNILKGLYYVLRHLGTILRKRGIVQRSRRVSEKSLWRSIHHEAPRGYAWQRFTRYIFGNLHG